MKVKVTRLLIGCSLYYLVQTRKHWWNRWHYVFDGSYPRLFTIEEVKQFCDQNK